MDAAVCIIIACTKDGIPIECLCHVQTICVAHCFGNGKSINCLKSELQCGTCIAFWPLSLADAKTIDFLFFFWFCTKTISVWHSAKKEPQISHSKLLFLRNKCGCHQMLCLLGSEIHTAIPERNLSASRRKQPGHLNKLRLITKQTRAKKLKRWQMPEQTANAVKVTNRWEIFVMPGQTSWFVCVHMSSSLASLHVWLPNRFKFPAIEQRAVATSRSGGVDRTQINYVATGQRRERRKKIMAIQKWSRMWRRWRWWS